MSDSRLHQAVEEGDLTTVKELLSNGVDIQSLNRLNETPLHIAACRGHVPIVKVLIEKGVPLGTRSGNGETPLHLAALKGHSDVVKTLLEFGADPNVKNKDGNTPLHYAVFGKHQEIVVLLSSQTELEIKNDKKETALHRATIQGNTSLMKILIDARANIYNLNQTGNTGAHHAAFNGRTEVVKLLLDCGFDVNFKNSKGNTIFHIAAREGHMELVNLLLKNNAHLESKNEDKETPLHLATIKGNIPLMKILIDAGGDVYNFNKTDNTGAHHAAFNGKSEVVKLLLDCGFDVNFKNSKGNTLLHHAAREGYQKLVTLLLENKAYVDILNKSEESPIMFAARLGHTDIVMQMNDAEDNQCNPNEHQPILHSAVIGKRLQTVQAIMAERRDKINLNREWRGATGQGWANISGNSNIAGWLSKQRDGMTQTPTYCRSHLPSCMDRYEKSGSHIIRRAQTCTRRDTQWLIKSIEEGEIEMHYMDSQGNTILHAAVESNNVDTVKELLKIGALPIACNHKNQTPLDIAKLTKRKAFSDLLEPQCKRRCLDSRIDTVKYEILLNIIAQSTSLDITDPRNMESKLEKKVDKMKLEAVQIVNKLLAESFPYVPLGSSERHLLLLAITCNNRTLLPTLLAAGLPLTTMDSGLGIVQIAWLTPELTTWVGMIVTRAVMHQLQMEQETLKEEVVLIECINVLLEDLNGSKPWEAQFKCQDDVSLTELFIIACGCGATIVAWYIWMAGARTFERAGPDNRTALETALSGGHISMATRLILDMGANPFMMNTEKKILIDEFPEDTRLLEIMLGQVYRHLDKMQEKAKEESEKSEFQQMILLLMVLFLQYNSGKSLDRWKSFLSLVLKGHSQINQKNTTYEANDWMTTLTKKLLEDGVNDFKFRDTPVTDRVDVEDSYGFNGVKFTKGNFNASEVIENVYDTVGLKACEKKYNFEVNVDPFYSLLHMLACSFYDSEVDESKHVKSISKQLPFLLNKALRISCDRHLPLLLHLMISEAKLNVESTINKMCKTKPLHHAAKSGNVSAVAYLLENGASSIIKDRSELSPVCYAYMYGHKSLGDYLLKHMKENYGQDDTDESTVPLWDANRKYLTFYHLNPESDSNSRYLDIRTYEELLNCKFEHIKNIWEQKGIKEAVAEIVVDYESGEAKEIKEAVSTTLKLFNEKLTEKSKLYEGILEFVGSSEDNVRLYCPDEFDCNLLLKNVSAYPGRELKATLKSLEEKKAILKGHSQCLEVECVDDKLEFSKTGSTFLDTFYNLARASLINVDLQNHRLKILLPGIKKTKVGIALSFLWSGTKYPMLFVDVDLVPTVRAPWPEDLPKPSCKLDSDQLKEVFLNSEGEDEWRFSFGHTECQIMKELPSDRREVYLACKMILAAMKTEEWVPRTHKCQYWYSRMFNLPSKGGFALKNSFFRELEEVTDDKEWESENLLIRMRSVFERMCILDDTPLEGTSEMNKSSIITPSPVKAYFGGDTEKAAIYLCAPEILRFLRSLNDSVIDRTY